MLWTLQEEISLLLLARTHFHTLLKAGKFNADSEVSIKLHADFNNNHRDRASLLYKLQEAGILKFAAKPSKHPTFICKITDDAPLYTFSVCTKLLKKPLHPSTIIDITERFQSTAETRPIASCITQVAAELQLEAMQVEKVLFEQGFVTINNARQYIATQHQGDTGSLTDIINRQMPAKQQIDDIDRLRANASKLYQVHQRAGAEVIFSSDGTGFGKSYGVIDGYARYLEQHALLSSASTTIVEGGFTNLIFMSPHKSQIDLAEIHKQRIMDAGGEFICVLARTDIYDMDFINWATGQTNRDRYLSWCKKAATSKRIKTNLYTLKSCINGIDSDHRRIKELTHIGSPEANDELLFIKNNLAYKQHTLIKTIQQACHNLLKHGDPKVRIPDYIERGLTARRQQQEKAALGAKASTTCCDEVYLEIIKQVLPFEVSLYIPSVLLMTTDKFDTTTKRVIPKINGEGNRFIDIPFDHIVGSKERLKNPKISTVSSAAHSEQVAYLREEHFKINPTCPFQERDVRFTIVIDELHESYERLEKSSHIKLVKKENNLAHVLSVVHRIYQEVKNLEARKVAHEEQSNFDREGLAFITRLRDAIQHKCDLSPGTTLDDFLGMFSNSLGAFEVSSNAAERIVSITRNIFSFNTKMFVNEQALKRIRIGHVKGNKARIELYYEVEGDASDTNPTLHDLFQLVSATLYTCAMLTDANYKHWIKDGGQEDASSQNTPLSNFIDAANHVSSEVQHIFDRTMDEDLEIDHFFTYLQPKTVFTLAPIEELNHYNKGAERSVTLAFEMDLVKELPEAMLLRMLSYTNNKVICLSATSGFTHTKNGSFSRGFLHYYANELGYKIIERSLDDLTVMKQLRALRASLRKVSFNSFDEKHDRLTDICTTHPPFRKVYRDIQKELLTELERFSNNPYTKRQINRELEALLLASYDKKNSLILSLSSDFKTVFARAYRNNTKNWRTLYHIKSLCDGKQGLQHNQIFELSPFKDKHKLRLVFFDAPLARITDIKRETYLCEPGMSLVFMSTYKSAGTGLNYFATYHDGRIDDPEALSLDVDFQRLVLINSPFYSEVIQPGYNLNRLPNYISLLKHFADDNEIHLMRDLSVNFTQGENYRLLMAEHYTSMFKVIVQAIGRVERRDTWLHSEIFLPNDVLQNVAFQFASVREKGGNKMVLESMSLLNYRMMEFSETLANHHSFADADSRKEFEQRMLKDGMQIDDVHKRVLTANWINQVRQGHLEYLTVCNLFRDPLSFTSPKQWIAKLKNNPIFAANKQMMAITDKMFIPRQQEQSTILLCHKRGVDGLPSTQRFALSDFFGGSREYQPERQVFPQYTQHLARNKEDAVRKIFNDYQAIQEHVFSEWAPHPAIIPLLKGNVGEAIFDAVLALFNVTPMTDEQVFTQLGTHVYELFDRFIEIENTLICIDVKNWASSLDNLTRAEDTVEKSENKIRHINTLVATPVSNEGENLVCSTLANQYEHIKFIYVNTNYNQNPNNLMWEENAKHTVHYLNLFQTEHQYHQVRNKQTQYKQHKSRLNRKMTVNPALNILLGITP